MPDDGDQGDWFEEQPEPVQRALASITGEIAATFDQFWHRAAERGDIAQLVHDFLAGELRFEVNRHGLLVVKDTPATGEGVPDSPADL